jgi:hypothetical protein
MLRDEYLAGDKMMFSHDVFLLPQHGEAYAHSQMRHLRPPFSPGTSSIRASEARQP